jgi:hypothetical protein
MRISDLTRRSEGRHEILSATLDNFVLWFRARDGSGVRDSADAFVAAALLPSMLQGADIEVDARYFVSTTLLGSLAELQDIFHCWNPLFRRVQIRCSVQPPEPRNDRVATFFSGGVDSQYTLLRQRGSIDTLITINGFDFDMAPELFSRVTARIEAFGAAYGIRTTAIETNFKSYGRLHNLSRHVTFGSCLASVALCLGYGRVFVPASHTYRELAPFASHPLTDRLWSNGATEIVHDGAGSARVEKLQALANDQHALDSLVVCWKSPDENCGRCEKCLRTMAALRLLGVSSRSLPPLDSSKALRRLHPTQRLDLEYIEENLHLARLRGDAEIARELQAVIRKYHVRRCIIDIDRAMLSGVFTKLYRVLHGTDSRRITFYTRPLSTHAPQRSGLAGAAHRGSS